MRFRRQIRCKFHRSIPRKRGNSRERGDDNNKIRDAWVEIWKPEGRKRRKTIRGREGGLIVKFNDDKGIENWKGKLIQDRNRKRMLNYAFPLEI